MNNPRRFQPRRLLALGTLLISAVGTAADHNDASVKSVMENSFAAKGQATLSRLNQDPTQALCTKYASKKLPDEAAERIVAMNVATVRYPADGKYLGDWQEGEKLAQTGVGKQFSDDPAQPSGGNCYACHQLTKAEIAYGNLGPSLYNYGKVRGTSEAIQKYTWTKLYNSDAITACSSMPRFGHMAILTDSQLKDVMALLLDPKSPVNH